MATVPPVRHPDLWRQLSEVAGPLYGMWVVGRSGTCTVLHTGPDLADEHCVIAVDVGGGWWVAALDPDGYTAVERDGARHRLGAVPWQAQPGDTLWIGGQAFPWPKDTEGEQAL